GALGGAGGLGTLSWALPQAASAFRSAALTFLAVALPLTAMAVSWQRGVAARASGLGVRGPRQLFYGAVNLPLDRRPRPVAARARRWRLRPPRRRPKRRVGPPEAHQVPVPAPPPQSAARPGPVGVDSAGQPPQAPGNAAARHPTRCRS